MVRYRPRARLAWLLLAGNLLPFMAGCVATVVQGPAFPGVADVFFCLVYPLLIAAVVAFARRRGTRRHPAELLDAGIVTTGIALVTWLHLIEPMARAHGVSVPARLVGIAYPVLDLLLLAVALRLSLVRGRRPPAYYLLAAGLTAYLLTDAGYCFMRLTGTYGGYHSWIVFGYPVFSALIGAAGLHPSMTEMDSPPASNDTAGTGGRIGFLAAVSLIVPAELVVAVLHGGPSRGDTLVIAGAVAVLVLLILIRMAALE